jgi:M6 family metalloprotease-like protein
MGKRVVAMLLGATLAACSGGGAKSTTGSGGSTAASGGNKGSGGGASGGTGGTAPGSGGLTATGGAPGSGGLGSGGTQGTGTGGASGGGGASGAGGADPNWPSYDDAVAGARSTRVLVLLLDFADSDQNQLVPKAEEAWGKMIFGRNQSNGNHFWYQTSGGQFQLLPAAETQGTPNNGVIQIKVSENKPTTGVLVAEQQPWVPEALDKAAAFVDFKSFDKNGDNTLTNDELSVLMIINWEFDQISGQPAQANIVLNHPIANTGVTLQKFARDMYLHTSIGISMHELGHHILDLDHTPSPTDHDLMGQGEYWPDPIISTLHDPDWFNATRPTQLKAIHKVRAGWVVPTELSSSMTGVKLYAPELGKKYNVIKLPVQDGFLLLDNRTAAGYDQSIPFCAQEAGAMFVDEVAQYLTPLPLATAGAMITQTDYIETVPTLCDVYALAGHNDSFTYGGWKISNVSAPGPTMTVDIEKLSGTPAVSYYALRTFWDDNGKRVAHQTKLDGTASTFDYSKLSGGTSVTGFVSLGLLAKYTTGESRSVSLNTTYTSDSPYFTIANAGKFTNGGAPLSDSLTYVTIHTDATKVTSAKVTFKTGTFSHTITFTNLPQN